MSKENKLIPELRFPEFKNEGEWKESLLGSEAEIKGRIGYRGYTVADIVEKGKGAITLSPSNFDENGRLKFEKCTYITWEKYEESPEIMLEIGQTVLVKTASVGKTAYVESLPEKATVNPQIVVLKPKKIFNRFLANSVAHQNTQIQINNCVGAGAIPNISQEIISKLKILVPPDLERKEQQKIASCISSLDEVIAAHSQKLDILKDHKKGLMQNLFPQEGERVPKYRFEEFENDGDWVEEILGELCDVRDGTHDSPKYVSKGYPMITSKNLLSTGMMDFENVSYLCEDDYNQINKRSKVDINDILFGMIGTIGNPVIVKTDGFAIKNVALIKSIGKLNQEFLLHQLKSNYILTQFEKVNAGGILKFIALGIIRNLIVRVPSPKEQDKIASCISSLDLLITSEAEKIEKLKLHKKGLMQSLFPKIID